MKKCCRSPGEWRLAAQPRTGVMPGLVSSLRPRSLIFLSMSGFSCARRLSSPLFRHTRLSEESRLEPSLKTFRAMNQAVVFKNSRAGRGLKTQTLHQ